MRVQTLELGKVTETQRDVRVSGTGGISDPHEGRGAGETMSLAPGSQMEEGQDMEEEDVFGRSTVLKNRKDTVVGQATPAQSGGVQESVGMFTDTFLPIADIPVDSTTRVAQKPQEAREGGAGNESFKNI